MKLFKTMDTAFENFDSTIRTYLSKTFNNLGMQYSHSQIFGVIFDGIKGVMQNMMFYIEDALTEQNVFKAIRKQSIYSLAKISGYEAYYGASASGTLLGKLQINNGLSSTASKVYIKNGTQIVNNNTGIKYVVSLPTEYYSFDVSKPLVTHQFKILQGSFAKHTYVAKGYSLETVHIYSNELFDRNYIKVTVDGVEWECVPNLYDMTDGGKQYIVNIGYDNTLDIMFGNGIYGTKLVEGQSVIMEFLKHVGSTANILPNEETNFKFDEFGYDTFGNQVNINDYMTLSMENCISGGTDADSIEFIREMIGSNSRSLVLASEDNFKLFFKRFSFIGYVNCWSEDNSMTIMATCMKNIEDEITDISDYYSMTYNNELKDKLILTDTQKEMVKATLDNSKKSFAGITLKFVDPVIRKYAVICYVKVANTYAKDLVKNGIKTTLAQYFISSLEDTKFIAKSTLIKLLLDTYTDIQSIDLDFISELSESAYKDGYYTTYKLKLVNGVYTYVEQQVAYEDGSTPGLDSYGNISLSTNIEIPCLHGWFSYYTNKSVDDYGQKDMSSIKIDDVQIYFIS